MTLHDYSEPLGLPIFPGKNGGEIKFNSHLKASLPYMYLPKVLKVSLRNLHFFDFSSQLMCTEMHTLLGQSVHKIHILVKMHTRYKQMDYRRGNWFAKMHTKLHMKQCLQNGAYSHSIVDKFP